MLRAVKRVVAEIPPVARYRLGRKVAAALAEWTPADQAMLEFYGQFAAAGERVFDVGANVGNRSKVFARMGCDVLAVEPQPACAALLRRHLGGRPAGPAFDVAQTAVGAAAGRVQMSVSNQHTVSSLMPDWIETMRANNRFGAGTRWDRQITVGVTTLDALIAAHGVPVFVKIDVEGYELEVVRGLSRPVRALSFEFMPEFTDRAVAVLDRLASLGPVEANLAEGEQMRFVDPTWVTVAAMRERLAGYGGKPVAWGDVYVRSVG